MVKLIYKCPDAYRYKLSDMFYLEYEFGCEQISLDLKNNLQMSLYLEMGDATEYSGFTLSELNVFVAEEFDWPSYNKEAACRNCSVARFAPKKRRL